MLERERERGRERKREAVERLSVPDFPFAVAEPEGAEHQPEEPDAGSSHCRAEAEVWYRGLIIEIDREKTKKGQLLIRKRTWR